MKLYLGLTESSAPRRTRIFGGREDRFIDLRLAYAAYRAQRENCTVAYEIAEFYFPGTIAAFLERGEQSRRALDELSDYAGSIGLENRRGPGGEKIFYEPGELRLLPPIQSPARSLVIGFSDRARAAGVPPAEIPTAFYKLPQTFVTAGAPLLWPKFSRELDVDACLAIVIGKPGRRIAAGRAWSHVAGATLLIDVTARDINRREGATTNNLLGKNFPSSTSLGPAFLPLNAPAELNGVEVQLSVDGKIAQRFKLGQCAFTVEEMIARWSILGLEAGDFLAIGASMTRAGEGLAGPVAVTPGATVRCWSEAIGALEHQVVRREA
jgi:2-keto-4-pentenoate hydratase/2-oxohepta-3-ene-1,7-dioic acid hydratase in catechol pathway